MKVLHIDSSISGEHSITQKLTAATVGYLREQVPGIEVVYRNLVAQEIRHLTGPIAAGFRDLPVTRVDAQTLREHLKSEELVHEFLTSSVIVIGAPMYNFSISSHLKAWLDRIAQAGRTFKYTEHGPVGLSGDKKVVAVSARGGFYSQAPLAQMDFQESYLKAFFAFLGITDITYIRAEGVSKGADVRSAQIKQALASLPTVVDEVVRRLK